MPFESVPQGFSGRKRLIFYFQTVIQKSCKKNQNWISIFFIGSGMAVFLVKSDLGFVTK